MRLALLLAASLGSCGQEAPAPRPETSRPQLALLTSLPILFGEQFGLEQPSSRLLTELEKAYRVVPIDGPEQLQPGGTLLAIQPQALTAERLVALDQWVRDGGRLVLLADPALTWESSRPLGDRFRPPFAFPDTGLLAHWGLRLTRLPEGAPGSTTLALGDGAELQDQESLGQLTSAPSANARCTAVRTAARCAVGKGTALIVADADVAMKDDPANARAIADLVEQARR